MDLKVLLQKLKSHANLMLKLIIFRQLILYLKSQGPNFIEGGNADNVFEGMN